MGMTEGVKYLLVWNAIFYILQHLLGPARALFMGLSFEQLFGVVPVLVLKKFFIWQVVTYMFLHSTQSFTHILFNMFGLWMFGTDVERIFGTRRFLIYYFFTGIGAGILTVIFSPGSITPTIGASGALFGLLIAFAKFFPNRQVLLGFIFPVSARVFVMIFAGMEILFLLSQAATDNVAHLAHLGGFLFGWVYLKWIGRFVDRWEAQRRKRGMRIVGSNSDRNPWGRS